MQHEFGIFNDEGLIEGGFYSEEEAIAAITLRGLTDDDVRVAQCCHEHAEEAADSCESCSVEDEDEADAEADAWHNACNKG